MAPNNVDPAEIAKFSVMAAQWWNPYGTCKPLHDINPLRYEFIKKYCSFEGLHILDVGCGGGILTESMAKAGGQVTGIDLSAEAIQVAMAHAQEHGLAINYQIASAEDFAQDQAGQFDMITCMELLEHVPDPSSVITACATLLKPSGHAFFSTINRNFKSYLYAVIGAEYLLKLLPKGTHQYEKFLRPTELFQMFQSEDLQLSHMAGMTYFPLTKKYQLTTDVSVNYLMHCYKSSYNVEAMSLD